MKPNKVEQLKTNAPRVKAKPLKAFWRRWSPWHLRARIQELETARREHNCRDEFRRPHPIYVAGDPRFEGAQSIFCRVEISERTMMTRDGPRSATCFVMSEDQSGTELEVIADAYGPAADRDDSGGKKDGK